MLGLSGSIDPLLTACCPFQSSARMLWLSTFLGALNERLNLQVMGDDAADLIPHWEGGCCAALSSNVFQGLYGGGRTSRAAKPSEHMDQEDFRLLGIACR